MTELRSSLLTQLAGPLQLPDALRVVGALRRLGTPYAPSEPRLRAIFLRNRTLHFTHSEAAIPRESAAAYLLNYVDLCRVNWYDTVTQYSAVFADDDAPPQKQSTQSYAAHGVSTNGVERAGGSESMRKVKIVRPAQAKSGDTLVILDPSSGASHLVTRWTDMIDVPVTDTDGMGMPVVDESIGILAEVDLPEAEGWGEVRAR